MPKFEIKNRFTGNIIYRDEAESLRALILAAIKSGTDLYGADLSRADLSGANLSGADLSRAYLSGAYGTPASGAPDGWVLTDGFWTPALEEEK